MRLAVIPARGGSKRIPKKNLREFCGQPIVAYSIEAALACPVIDRVWVSTDDADIARIARQSGAEVPFVRPAHLSDDHTVMKDVMQHALSYARDASISVDAACLIFATAPLLNVWDIEHGYQALQAPGTDFALSVTPFRNAPQRAQFIDSSGHLRYREPEYCQVRSQDLAPLFHDAAQFVWGRPCAFDGVDVTDANVVPVCVDADGVIDIDTLADWAYAESLYRARLSASMMKAS